MRSNRQVVTYIIFGLIIIGIISSFFKNPAPMIIPLLVFGVIFLLYKYPPAQLRRAFKSKTGRGHSSTGSRPSTKSGSSRKNTTFRVIKGNKRDDDEPPRYH
jgi:hypothetical protein